MKINKKLSVLVILGLTSCSVNTPLTGGLNKSDDVKITNLNKSVDKLKVQPPIKEQHLNIDAGLAKSGASFSIKIDSNQKISNNFSTKANESGNLGKTSSDVQSYEVYLIKNTQATYPANADPIGKKAAGPFNVNSNGTTSSTITFTNVGDSQGEYYYVALRALDGVNGQGNNLIKTNINWTGTTASTPYNKQVAVSTNGVTVSSTFVVNPITTININPDLIDAVGAKIEANVTVNNGVLPAAKLTGRNNIIQGEFRVNTYITGYQYNPSVASDDNGNFVVVWESRYQDGDRYGIYAQRYNSNGTVNGSEFQVNSYTIDDQGNPSVAMDNDGDFVVTWQSRNQDGFAYGIYAQRYNSNGTVNGSEFQVNNYIIYNQRSPSVAMDSDGDFVISWLTVSQDQSSYEISAQRYNSDGTVNGSEFQVNTTITDAQLDPSVAMNSDGDFIIAWQSNESTYYGNSYAISTRIYAQRYNSLGVAQGLEFPVNATTIANQSNSSVAMDSDGDFVISWQSFNQDGSGDGVYAQRYNSDGTVNGSEFSVNTYTSNNQQFPSVAMDSNGDFVISWQSDGQDGSNNGVYAQRYNSAGQVQGSEFSVNTYTASSQSLPSVAMDSDGNFVVTWQSDQDGIGYGVYAKRYNSSGVTQ